MMTSLGVFLGVFGRDGIFFFVFGGGIGLEVVFFGCFFLRSLKQMRAVMNIGGEYFASYDVKRRMERLSVSL